jgi:hypothetical protein
MVKAPVRKQRGDHCSGPTIKSKQLTASWDHGRFHALLLLPEVLPHIFKL